MRYSKIHGENAVSPVVGVMLMLVVTIIIAAVVSAYAGGFGGNSAKPVTATIKGTYSQSDGMTITHTGGDTIACAKTEIFVESTDLFGPSARIWKPNASVIQISKNGQLMPWVNTTKTNALGLSANNFVPGETAIVNEVDLGQVQPARYSAGIEQNGLLSDAMMNSTTGAYATNSNYGFLFPGNQGNSFKLRMATTDGRTVAETLIKIAP